MPSAAEIAPSPPGPPIRGDDTVTTLVPFGSPEAHEWGRWAASAWAVRGHAGFAASVLAWGVCEVCALGPRGLRDDAGSGLHLCGRRLAALRDHVAPPLAPADLVDVARLRRMDEPGLRALGRLGHPFVRWRGERGFRRVEWEEAAGAVAERVASVPGERMAFATGMRGPTDESWYAFSKAARLLGSNNVGTWRPPLLRALVAPLERALGTGAATGSLASLALADLVLLVGPDPLEGMPMLADTLARAKGRGARVAFVGPSLPPRLQEVFVPTLARSALFGTRLADDLVRTGEAAEATALLGALKALVERGWHDPAFVARSTAGWERARDAALALSWAEIEASGAPRRDVEWLAELVARAGACTSIVTSPGAMGAVVDLHLARGLLGEGGSAILPVAERPGEYSVLPCGLAPDLLPGGHPVGEVGAAALESAWGYPVPTRPGTAPREAAGAKGEFDLLWSLGGDPLPTDIPVQVFQSTFLSPGMLAGDPALTVLLPARNRFEQRGGGTCTSVERRVRFTPEIGGHPAPREARCDFDAVAFLARALRPGLADAFVWSDAGAIRAEMEHVVPALAGVRSLRAPGDWLQRGGDRLELRGGRARFHGGSQHDGAGVRNGRRATE